MIDPGTWSPGEAARVDKIDALKRMMEWLADRTRSREDAGYDLRLSGGIGSSVIAFATDVTSAAEATLATCWWWGVDRYAFIDALAAPTSADARIVGGFWLRRPPSGAAAQTLSASGETLEFKMYNAGALTVRRIAGTRAWFIVVRVTTT